jgi:hypothetical protein
MTRVLRVPGTHPYVDACLGAVADRTGGSPTAIPSPALDPAWVAAHHTEFDSVHLHFGYEHLSLDELASWLRSLADHRKPLIVTVHDLRNPHQASPRHHLDQLDLLIPAAAVVLTLTPGAGAQIHHRWGRSAEVLGHPFVIDPARRPPRTAPGRRAGLHLKDLRRNVADPDLVVAAAARGAAAVGGRLRVDLHPGVLDRPELAGTRALAAAGVVDLAVHPRFTDEELAEYLCGLDAFVLPYRFGTHSGWLEAGRDVGTRVVAPSCGHYADQWSQVLTYRYDEESGLDGDDLARAVADALTRPAAEPADPAMRHDQLRLIQAVHARRHAEAVLAVTGGGGADRPADSVVDLRDPARQAGR